ncbi:hemagglutinin [Campylobacter jejuni]|uniref:hemagglutinin n=1 Tax=Campylobacter jejuni TaxID=197 RepID=UPI000ABAF71B|nr:hemagglutinin [Campylobacter jejuni]MDQ6377091.1 hemagglutinin [Campylobacter jejuni]MDQ6380128.1 hemagglutinin [Campylobacter jejuni]MDQ6382160.1 hemagglutinin [Campylobacter jejuni]
MKEFAKDGKLSAFEGDPKTISPVIKSNAGNVINLETMTVREGIAMVGKYVTEYDSNNNHGRYFFTSTIEKPAYLYVYSPNDFFTSLAANGPSMTGATKSLVGTGAIKNRENYKETSDLIAKDNISNEVLNSIFNDLKFNSSVDISDLSKFLLTADELTSINQSMDFITALYGQTQDSNNATFANALKEVLGNSYGDLGKANQVIIKTKEILSQNS